MWYEGTDSAGARALYIYPTPAADGDAITVEYVYRAADLSVDDDAPSEFPEEFHPGLLHYVASVYYDTVEDNADLAQRNSERFDGVVSELARHRILRKSGEGVFQLGVIGVSA